MEKTKEGFNFQDQGDKDNVKLNVKPDIKAKIKIAPDVAEEEINAWLDYKKVMSSTREAQEENIRLLTDAVEDGVVKIDEKTKVMTHTLIFPLGDDASITTIEYTPRMNDRMLEPYLKGVKAGDGDGRIAAYICAATKLSKGIVKTMDSVDKKIALANVLFFI